MGNPELLSFPSYFTISARGLKYTNENFERGYFKFKAQNQI